MEELRSCLERGIILFDGAMGTTLQAAGALEGVSCPEELNTTRPEMVEAIHCGYVEAGAQVITTNSFGGSRVRLARSGLAEKAAELNRAAAQIARKAAGDEVLVAGSIGPLGEFLAPLGPIALEEAVRAFAEQSQALAEGGADLIIIETMYDLAEARAAIQGAKRATNLPIIACMAFGENLHTIMGVSSAQAAQGLSQEGVFALGANCGECDLEGMADIVRQMREAAPEATLIVQPNAGKPQLTSEGTIFPATPQEMAQYAKRYVELGAQIVGACCGSTPEHTKAIAKALRKR